MCSCAFVININLLFVCICFVILVSSQSAIGSLNSAAANIGPCYLLAGPPAELAAASCRPALTAAVAPNGLKSGHCHFLHCPSNLEGLRLFCLLILGLLIVSLVAEPDVRHRPKEDGTLIANRNDSLVVRADFALDNRPTVSYTNVIIIAFVIAPKLNKTKR